MLFLRCVLVAFATRALAFSSPNHGLSESEAAGGGEYFSKFSTLVPRAPVTNLTSTLSKIIADSATVPVPDAWRILARSHILDTLASIVACRDLEPSTLARELALSLSGGRGRSAATILGTHEQASIVDAAFASAMAGHGAEINDFVPSAFVQPGPSVVSVALALAETRGLSGDAVLRAVIVGYEFTSRIPKALGINNLQNANIANHGIGPTFGAAAAAASLLRLSEEQISYMLGYCAQQASGTWQWLLDVEHIEKSFVFAGMGAKAGLSAALMAEAGFRGVENSFDSEKGFITSKKFTGGDENLESLLDFGNKTELSETGYKRYPVGGPTQPAVHGLLSLLPNITVTEVSKVVVEMPGAADSFRSANMPALNLKYLVAIILIDQRLDFVSAQSRERMLGDQEVQALMLKVEVVEDPSQEPPPGEARTESARVKVEETGGRRHEVYVPYVKGYPSHPMSKEEVDLKALELMEPHLGDKRARAVIATTNAIDRLPRIGELVKLISR
ncbi:MmgE/PrpD family protein [Eremomyces bilateralis CBS 781.70]|uniref:MmgE/PrpD family protein n=1 Tax=Eremomyces bilateralis CBS 781.70 TaxID=1392243 RepID=A0A6G1FV91_9PEZI|nr:MmgE/PrpD family protein [Eremomyces bilateralis CBS 781.70]KAF1809650.1 MmgE/PrpD family protein [Eremomyces bilateralis CBS 781.70]